MAHPIPPPRLLLKPAPAAGLYLAITLTAALQASAALPSERAIVARVPLEWAGRGTQYATLFAGQAVDVVKTVGGKTRVRTRGAIRIEGWVPSRQLGICAREQAPARLRPDADPIGYVPAAWCFRILDERGEYTRMADPGFGLTVLVETRFLTAEPDPRKRFEPILGGFVDYRIQPQPMRRTPTEAPYYTVAQGEWPMRSTHEEGEQAFIEVLGTWLVLQGWERTTSLYKDLFEPKDEVELARRRLAERRRPGADPRPWFRLKKGTKLFAEPGRQPVGDADTGVFCTVNRTSGPWRQIRLERDKDGRSIRFLETTLWIHGDILDRVRSAFDQ